MKFTYFRADHTTTIEEAKRQYHRLCLRWHPDRPDDGRNQEPLRLPEGGDGEAGRSDGIEKGD